jgi:hypothetical protein
VQVGVGVVDALVEPLGVLLDEPDELDPLVDVDVEALVEGEVDALVDGVVLGEVRSMPVPIICFVASGSLGWFARYLSMNSFQVLPGRSRPYSWPPDEL